MAKSKEAVESDESMREAKVVFLDSTEEVFAIRKRANGGELMEKVASHLRLINEKEYFSFLYNDRNGKRTWLYDDKRISKQLKGEPWEFYFQVKFYPPDPTALCDDLIRYQMCLQLRQDIFTNKIPATLATHALLGSYVMQSELGDYTPNEEQENFVRNSKIAPAPCEALFEKVREIHKEHKGQTPAEADLQYLENVKKLSLYGISTIAAKDSKGVPMTIGVGAHGINVYRDQARLHRFIWQNIIKIAYRRNVFAIKVRPGELEKKETNVSYKLTDHEAAKRFWKLCVENHTFFRLIQPEEKPHKGLFRWGSARFRYQGRTQFQSKMASQMFGQPVSDVQRSYSARLPTSKDDSVEIDILRPTEEVSPTKFMDDGASRNDLLGSPKETDLVLVQEYQPAELSKRVVQDEVKYDEDKLKVGGAILDTSSTICSTSLMHGDLIHPSSVPPSDSSYSRVTYSSSLGYPHPSASEEIIEQEDDGHFYVRRSYKDRFVPASLHCDNDDSETEPTSLADDSTAVVYHPRYHEDLLKGYAAIREEPPFDADDDLVYMHDPQIGQYFRVGIADDKTGFHHQSLNYLERKSELDNWPVKYFVDKYHSGYSYDDYSAGNKNFEKFERKICDGVEEVIDKEKIDKRTYPKGHSVRSPDVHRIVYRDDLTPAPILKYTKVLRSDLGEATSPVHFRKRPEEVDTADRSINISSRPIGNLRLSGELPNISFIPRREQKYLHYDDAPSPSGEKRRRIDEFRTSESPIRESSTIKYSKVKESVSNEKSYYYHETFMEKEVFEGRTMDEDNVDRVHKLLSRQKHKPAFDKEERFAKKRQYGSESDSDDMEVYRKERTLNEVVTVHSKLKLGGHKSTSDGAVQTIDDRDVLLRERGDREFISRGAIVPEYREPREVLLCEKEISYMPFPMSPSQARGEARMDLAYQKSENEANLARIVDPEYSRGRHDLDRSQGFSRTKEERYTYPQGKKEKAWITVRDDDYSPDQERYFLNKSGASQTLSTADTTLAGDGFIDSIAPQKDMPFEPQTTFTFKPSISSMGRDRARDSKRKKFNVILRTRKARTLSEGSEELKLKRPRNGKPYMHSDVYEGPLDKFDKDIELEHFPVQDHVRVYHSGRSALSENVQPRRDDSNKRKAKALISLRSDLTEDDDGNDFAIAKTKPKTVGKKDKGAMELSIGQWRGAGHQKYTVKEKPLSMLTESINPTADIDKLPLQVESSRNPHLEFIVDEQKYPLSDRLEVEALDSDPTKKKAFIIIKDESTKSPDDKRVTTEYFTVQTGDGARDLDSDKRTFVDDHMQVYVGEVVALDKLSELDKIDLLKENDNILEFSDELDKMKANTVSEIPFDHSKIDKKPIIEWETDEWPLQTINPEKEMIFSPVSDYVSVYHCGFSDSGDLPILDTKIHGHAFFKNAETVSTEIPAPKVPTYTSEEVSPSFTKLIPGEELPHDERISVNLSPIFLPKKQETLVETENHDSPATVFIKKDVEEKVHDVYRTDEMQPYFIGDFVIRHDQTAINQIEEMSSDHLKGEPSDSTRGTALLFVGKDKPFNDQWRHDDILKMGDASISPVKGIAANLPLQEMHPLDEFQSRPISDFVARHEGTIDDREREMIGSHLKDYVKPSVSHKRKALLLLKERKRPLSDSDQIYDRGQSHVDIVKTGGDLAYNNEDIVGEIHPLDELQSRPISDFVDHYDEMVDKGKRGEMSGVSHMKQVEPSGSMKRKAFLFIKRREQALGERNETGDEEQYGGGAIRVGDVPATTKEIGKMFPTDELHSAPIDDSVVRRGETTDVRAREMVDVPLKGVKPSDFIKRKALLFTKEEKNLLDRDQIGHQREYDYNTLKVDDISVGLKGDAITETTPLQDIYRTDVLQPTPTGDFVGQRDETIVNRGNEMVGVPHTKKVEPSDSIKRRAVLFVKGEKQPFVGHGQVGDQEYDFDFSRNGGGTSYDSYDLKKETGHDLSLLQEIHPINELQSRPIGDFVVRHEEAIEAIDDRENKMIDVFRAGDKPSDLLKRKALLFLKGEKQPLSDRNDIDDQGRYDVDIFKMSDSLSSTKEVGEIRPIDDLQHRLIDEFVVVQHDKMIGGRENEMIDFPLKKEVEPSDSIKRKAWLLIKDKEKQPYGERSQVGGQVQFGADDFGRGGVSMVTKDVIYDLPMLQEMPFEKSNIEDGISADKRNVFIPGSADKLPILPEKYEGLIDDAHVETEFSTLPLRELVNPPVDQSLRVVELISGRIPDQRNISEGKKTALLSIKSTEVTEEPGREVKMTDDSPQFKFPNFWKKRTAGSIRMNGKEVKSDEMYVDQPSPHLDFDSKHADINRTASSSKAYDVKILTKNIEPTGSGVENGSGLRSAKSVDRPSRTISDYGMNNEIYTGPLDEMHYTYDLSHKPFNEFISIQNPKLYESRELDDELSAKEKLDDGRLSELDSKMKALLILRSKENSLKDVDKRQRTSDSLVRSATDSLYDRPDSYRAPTEVEHSLPSVPVVDDSLGKESELDFLPTGFIKTRSPADQVKIVVTTDVRPESQWVSSDYTGPSHTVNRVEELESTPIREYSSVYHTGLSDMEEGKSEIIDVVPDTEVGIPELKDELLKQKAILFFKESMDSPTKLQEQDTEGTVESPTKGRERQLIADEIGDISLLPEVPVFGGSVHGKVLPAAEYDGKLQIRPEDYSFAKLAYDGPLERIERDNELPVTSLSSYVEHIPADVGLHYYPDVSKREQESISLLLKEKDKLSSEAIRKKLAKVYLKEKTTDNLATRDIPGFSKEKETFPRFDASNIDNLVCESELPFNQTEVTFRDRSLTEGSLSKTDEYTYQPIKAFIQPKSKRVPDDGTEIIEKSKLDMSAYRFSNEAYQGPLDDMHYETDITSIPVRDYATVYHSGLSHRPEYERLKTERNCVIDESGRLLFHSERKKKAIVHVKEKYSIDDVGDMDSQSSRIVGKFKDGIEGNLVRDAEGEYVPSISYKQKQSKDFIPKTTRSAFLHVKSGSKSSDGKRGEDIAMGLPTDYANEEIRIDDLAPTSDLIKSSPLFETKIDLKEGSTSPKPCSDLDKTHELGFQPIAQLVTDNRAKKRWHDESVEYIEKSKIDLKSYRLSKDPYTGEYDKMNCAIELDRVPIKNMVTVYHSGLSASTYDEHPVRRPIMIGLDSKDGRLLFHPERKQKALIYVKEGAEDFSLDEGTFNSTTGDEKDNLAEAQRHRFNGEISSITPWKELSFDPNVIAVEYDNGASELYVGKREQVSTDSTRSDKANDDDDEKERKRKAKFVLKEDASIRPLTDSTRFKFWRKKQDYDLKDKDRDTQQGTQKMKDLSPQSEADYLPFPSTKASQSLGREEIFPARFDAKQDDRLLKKQYIPDPSRNDKFSADSPLDFHEKCLESGSSQPQKLIPSGSPKYIMEVSELKSKSSFRIKEIVSGDLTGDKEKSEVKVSEFQPPHDVASILEGAVKSKESDELASSSNKKDSKKGDYTILIHGVQRDKPKGLHAERGEEGHIVKRKKHEKKHRGKARAFLRLRKSSHNMEESDESEGLLICSPVSSTATTYPSFDLRCEIEMANIPLIDPSNLRVVRLEKYKELKEADLLKYGKRPQATGYCSTMPSTSSALSAETKREGTFASTSYTIPYVKDEKVLMKGLRIYSYNVTRTGSSRESGTYRDDGDDSASGDGVLTTGSSDQKAMYKFSDAVNEICYEVPVHYTSKTRLHRKQEETISGVKITSGKKVKKRRKKLESSGDSSSSSSISEGNIAALHSYSKMEYPTQVLHCTRELPYKDLSSSAGYDAEPQMSGHIFSTDKPYVTQELIQTEFDPDAEPALKWDEQGRMIIHPRLIEKTIRTQKVKHTVQSQSHQTFTVMDSQKPGVQAVECAQDSITPSVDDSALMGEVSPLVESIGSTITFEGTTTSEPRSISVPGELISCRSVTAGRRTIERITYKVENNGVIETHVEHRVIIHDSDDKIDHDAELNLAILEATHMNPEMTVEKIEVRQESQC